MDRGHRLHSCRRRCPRRYVHGQIGFYGSSADIQRVRLSSVLTRSQPSTPSHFFWRRLAPPGEHDWPPIILLNEAKDYYFESKEARFYLINSRRSFGPVMKELLGIIAKYPRASVIEVIGHTDEQRIIGSSSNLDETLVPVIRRKEPIMRLKPADNAGLGLARAVAVSQVLLQDARLEGFAILPYSGGQLVNVGDVLVLSGGGGDERVRRRIEIRVREPNKVSVPSAAADPTRVAPSPQRPPPAPRVIPKQSDSAVVQSQEPPQPVIPKPRS